MTYKGKLIFFLHGHCSPKTFPDGSRCSTYFGEKKFEMANNDNFLEVKALLQFSFVFNLVNWITQESQN